MAASMDVLRKHMQQTSAEGQTCKEIAVVLGVGELRAREVIRAALQAGDLKVTRLRRQAMDGRLATVPGYQLASRKGKR